MIFIFSYACFAEISSISSSIFDSMCDQFAKEQNFNNNINDLSKANATRV